MNTTEALRAIIADTGESNRVISARMNRSENYVTSLLRQAERMGADMNASTVAGIAAACGYALALVPVDRVPEGAVVIDAPSRDAGE